MLPPDRSHLAYETDGYGVEPLHLAVAIIGADDGAEDFTEIRHRYSAELSALRDLAEQNLALADGPVEFVYALQARPAIEGIPTWQNRLDARAYEELGVACPQCLEYLYLDLAGPDFTTTVADDGTATPTRIISARPDDLGDGAARMHDPAACHRHTDVATRGSSISLGTQPAPPAAADSVFRALSPKSAPGTRTCFRGGSRE